MRTIAQSYSYQQSHKIDVFVKRIFISLDGELAELHLLILGLDPRRQQPVDSKGLALLDGKRHTLSKEKKQISWI